MRAKPAPKRFGSKYGCLPRAPYTAGQEGKMYTLVSLVRRTIVQEFHVEIASGERAVERPLFVVPDMVWSTGVAKSPFQSPGKNNDTMSRPCTISVLLRDPLFQVFFDSSPVVQLDRVMLENTLPHGGGEKQLYVGAALQVLPNERRHCVGSFIAGRENRPGIRRKNTKTHELRYSFPRILGQGFYLAKMPVAENTAG